MINKFVLTQTHELAQNMFFNLVSHIAPNMVLMVPFKLYLPSMFVMTRILCT